MQKYKKVDLYNHIMKAVSKTVKNVLNEGIHPDDIKSLNIDWDKISRIHHWWDGITYDNPVKYPAKELKTWDIVYDEIIWKMKKVLHVNDINKVTFIFDNEPEWSLCIEKKNAYGSNAYTMYAHGGSAPWRISFSEMGINMKRSIKQRLDEKTFYIYYIEDYDEYIIRETPEYKEMSGILFEK